MMTDLIAFLRARLAEDEATARAAFSGQCDPENGWGAERSVSGGWTITPHVGNIHEKVQARHVEAWNPARVIAEVAAKRAIIGLCEPWGIPEDIMVLRLLAQPYADHPDFAPAWRLPE